MAYFLFVDESGQDRRESPYEVLAGVAVEDRDIWNLVQALRSAEVEHFGVRYTADTAELKAKKLLKKKTFRLAAQLPPFPLDECAEPFFVHSELTTGVQLADLVAYVLSWGFRIPGMHAPARPELGTLVDRACHLRHRAVRERMGNPQFVIWSFALINDLRARDEVGEG